MPGTIPGKSFNKIATIKNNGQPWDVYTRDYGDYLNIKLVLLTDIGKKANFWISVRDGKFIKSNDTKVLFMDYYDLYERLCAVLKLTVKDYKELNE